jgi:protein-S-isoprenylcysteine O-methyltransferase Ste14
VDYVFEYNVLTGNRFDFLPIRFAASIGCLILFMSFMIIMTAQSQMKTSWRIEIDAKNSTPLIEAGLFRYSRNPIFLALRLSYFAMFLIVPCPYSLITLLIGDLAFQAQVRQEEQHLSRTHGAVYRDYCSRAPRWLLNKRGNFWQTYSDSALSPLHTLRSSSPRIRSPEGSGTPQLENGYGQKLTPVRQAFALRLLS